MEFYIIVNSKIETEGKHIVVAPRKTIRVTVGELLPEEYKDMRNLEGISTSLQVSNTSNIDDAEFRATIEGPFKPEKSEEEFAVMASGKKIIEIHQKSIYYGSAGEKRELLKDPIPEEYKIRKDLYTTLCHTRGRMFSSLMMLDEADKSFEAGHADYYDKIRWFFLLDWAHTLMLTVNAQVPNVEKKLKVERAIKLLETIKLWSKTSTYEKYNNIVAEGMMAFCRCFLGKPEEAKKILTAIDYTPIAIANLHTQDMNSFYDYFGYTIAAAIELKDNELLKKICTMITIGKRDIEKELNAWRCLKITFGYVRQNGKFQLKTLFDIFKENNTNYYPELINFTAFLKLMKRNDEAGMENYFLSK